MKQILLLVSLCLCLASCCNKMYYEAYSDISSFKDRYYTLYNDLARQSYYCGSDVKWHYFAVKRHIVWHDEFVGIKLPSDIKLPFVIRKNSDSKNQWLVIDCYGDWVSDLNGEQSQSLR